MIQKGTIRIHFKLSIYIWPKGLIQNRRKKRGRIYERMVCIVVIVFSFPTPAAVIQCLYQIMNANDCVAVAFKYLYFIDAAFIRTSFINNTSLFLPGGPTVFARNTTPIAYPGSPLHLIVEFCANPPAHAARWLHGDRVYTPGNQYGIDVLAYGFIVSTIIFLYFILFTIIIFFHIIK